MDLVLHTVEKLLPESSPGIAIPSGCKARKFTDKKYIYLQSVALARQYTTYSVRTNYSILRDTLPTRRNRIIVTRITPECSPGKAIVQRLCQAGACYWHLRNVSRLFVDDNNSHTDLYHASGKNVCNFIRKVRKGKKKYVPFVGL